MAIDTELLLHPSDKAALQALKSIPGFHQLVKAYMGVMNERQLRILNMSSNLRLSETQMPEYYNLLPPICAKLGIPVPELYLELNVVPNAYTYGDTNPFIVITSGLLDTMPEHLIATVLAHECGHIACHHTLYTTMGRMILTGIDQFVSGLASLLTTSIRMAFAYWMRCSEFSADRAAVLCDGSPEKMQEVCFRFTGYGKHIHASTSMDSFLAQAEEYRAMIVDDTWNKTLEFLLLSGRDHPLTAVRALECGEWAASEQFTKVLSLMQYRLTDGSTGTADAPAPEASKACVRRSREDVLKMFSDVGFTDLTCVRTTEKGPAAQNGQVVSVLIDGETPFEKGQWIPLHAHIIVTYYEPPTEAEIAAAHPNEIRLPKSCQMYVGRPHEAVTAELRASGFTNVVEYEDVIKPNWLQREGNVTRVIVGSDEHVKQGTWVPADAFIIVGYAVFEKSPETESNPVANAAQDAMNAAQDAVNAVNSFVGNPFKNKPE